MGLVSNTTCIGFNCEAHLQPPIIFKKLVKITSKKYENVLSDFTTFPLDKKQVKGGGGGVHLGSQLEGMQPTVEGKAWQLATAEWQVCAARNRK